MLPFLAYPRRYTQSTITRYWLDCLERTKQKTPRVVRLVHWLLIALTILGAAAPFVMPIYTLDRMLIVYIPALALTWFMAIRTLVYTSTLVQREADLELWETLVLTGVSAQQLVFGKWWAIIHFFARDYLRAACLRLFTAYGLATYFFTIPFSACPLGLNAFCYGTTGWTDPNPPPWMPLIHPLLLLTAFAAVLLGGFALSELALTSAIGVFAGNIFKRRKVGMFWATMTWVMIIIVGLAGLALIHKGIDQLQGITRGPSAIYTQEYECIYCFDVLKDIRMSPARLVDILETVQLTISTFIDNGSLLASNFLHGVSWPATFDFLARNLVASVLGLLLSISLIWFLLRLSVRLAIRQGAMPPQEG